MSDLPGGVVNILTDWFSDSAQSVYEIRNFIEFKTTWYPIGA